MSECESQAAATLPLQPPTISTSRTPKIPSQGPQLDTFTPTPLHDLRTTVMFYSNQPCLQAATKPKPKTFSNPYSNLRTPDLPKNSHQHQPTTPNHSHPNTSVTPITINELNDQKSVTQNSRSMRTQTTNDSY
ncbi:hypothetical protein Droror1_Dr00015067 [Drosera rotundifolia]